MRLDRMVLLVVMFVLGSVVSPAAGASPTHLDGRRSGGEITVVDIGNFYSLFIRGLSERGHVAFSEADLTGGSFGRAVVWYRGEKVNVTPDDPTAYATIPVALNNRGDVVGTTLGGDGLSWVWRDGTWTALQPDPGEWLSGADIDDRGRLLINRQSAAILHRDREITSPSLPDGGTIFGVAMNNHLRVIGTAPTPGGSGAYLWPVGRPPLAIGPAGAQSSEPAEINDHGTVLGTWTTAEGAQRMFLWRRGTAIDLGTLGGPSTGVPDQRVAPADKLNERGQVVGTSETASGALHAFLWSDGRMRDLGTLGGTESRAYGINDRGEVVGESLTASGETHAFLWRRGEMIDLGAVLGTGMQSYAVAINNRGQVVGVRSYAGQYDSIAVLWET